MKKKEDDNWMPFAEYNMHVIKFNVTTKHATVRQ